MLPNGGAGMLALTGRANRTAPSPRSSMPGRTRRDGGAEQQVEGELEGCGVRVADRRRDVEQVEPGGCVLQHVDRAESRVDRLDHAGQRVAVGDVAGEPGGLDAVRG